LGKSHDQGGFENPINPGTPGTVRLAVLQLRQFDRHQTQGQETPFTRTKTLLA